MSPRQPNGNSDLALQPATPFIETNSAPPDTLAEPAPLSLQERLDGDVHGLPSEVRRDPFERLIRPGNIHELPVDVRMVQMDRIKIDDTIWFRANRDPKQIEEIAALIEANVPFPPPVVCPEGEIFVPADGIKTLRARQILGEKDVACRVLFGGRDAAALYAAAANIGQGRNDDDTALAVRSMLKSHGDWNDSQIANWCGTYGAVVDSLRPKMTALEKSNTTRKYSVKGKIYTRKASTERKPKHPKKSEFPEPDRHWKSTDRVKYGMQALRYSARCLPDAKRLADVFKKHPLPVVTRQEVEKLRECLVVLEAILQGK